MRILITPDNIEEYKNILSQEFIGLEFKPYNKGKIAENVYECTLPVFLAFYIDDNNKMSSQAHTVVYEKTSLWELTNKANQDNEYAYYLYEAIHSDNSSHKVVRYAKVPKILKD